MLSFEEAKKLFELLYADIDGHYISTQARRRLPYYDKSLTYGEVTPESFQKILDKIKVKNGEIFYDLGCGTGKAVILAAMFGNFSRIIGIDILKELTEAAKKALQRYQNEMKNYHQQTNQQNIQFVNEDFLKYDLKDADVIFAHSTCFPDETMSALQQKITALKVGSRVVVVTKWLNTPYYKLISREEYPFTWGRGTVSFYEKVL